MHDEMPGFFPGRPGGEHDEPLLDMILERRPIPPGAPPEFHGLARVLAAVAGPAEPGDLAGQDGAHAAFTRLASRPGTSHAALRSARRSLSERPARGRLPQAAALAVAAAGLGSIAAAFDFRLAVVRMIHARRRIDDEHHALPGGFDAEESAPRAVSFRRSRPFPFAAVAFLARASEQVTDVLQRIGGCQVGQ